jgi:hypothetical protein
MNLEVHLHWNRCLTHANLIIYPNVCRNTRALHYKAPDADTKAFILEIYCIQF